MKQQRPTPNPQPSWWTQQPRDGFTQEARKRQDVTNESTLGLYTGRKPTATLVPTGWENVYDD